MMFAIVGTTKMNSLLLFKILAVFTAGIKSNMPMLVIYMFLHLIKTAN